MDDPCESCDAKRQADVAGQSADAAARSAADSGRAAAASDEKAVAAGRSTERLMRLLHEVVLSEEQSNFCFGQASLPEAAKSELDELANRLKADSVQKSILRSRATPTQRGRLRLTNAWGSSVRKLSNATCTKVTCSRFIG